MLLYRRSLDSTMRSRAGKTCIATMAAASELRRTVGRPDSSTSAAPSLRLFHWHVVLPITFVTSASGSVGVASD